MPDLKSVQLLARNGKKIAAIKELKDRYSGIGLKKAKDIVDGLERGELSIESAEAFLNKLPKRTQAVDHDSSAGTYRSPDTLISRKKTDYTKLLLVFIIICLLMYIFFLQS